MKQELDSIVAELCAFDADLAKDPGLVRRIVEELQRSKPAVVIDDSFRAQLRSDLLHAHRAKASRPMVPAWLLYAAPVGVAALVLMFIGPSFAPFSTLAPHPPKEAPADAVMKMATPSMSSDSSESGATATGLERTITAPLQADYFTALITSNTVAVSYLTTTKPSYIVVTDTAGNEVAVSELFDPGEHINTSFSARVAFVTDVIYTATLYYDSGDGVYTKATDEVAVDETGNAVSIPLALP